MCNRQEDLDFIPSQTVRAYARKIRHPFSDTDIAAILYHAPPRDERTAALRELAARTLDAALREQIEERLDYETRLRERFEANDGSFFYAVDIEMEEKGLPKGHYASAKAALAAGKAREKPFCVSKYQLGDLRDKSAAPYIYFDSPYFGQPVAEYYYDKDGAVQLCWSHEVTQEEWERLELWNAARFEERFVSLPNPFERGDVVCMANDPGQVGVVETSQEDWRDVQTKKRDFCSASLAVEWLDEDGKFICIHIPPISLERATLDKTDARTPLLEAASRLLRGKGALNKLFQAGERYLAHTGKRK